MKKTLALLLVLMLTLSLAAAASAEPVKLVIAARGGSHVDVINAVKAEFEKENNCVIEVLGLENADLKQKMALDSRNQKGAYDIVMLDDPWMPEVTEAGLLLDLTQAGYADDADFVKTSLALGKAPYGTGDTFALPFAGNVTLLFYNEAVLSAAGAQAPDSWQGVLDIAKAVNGKDGKIGYVIRGQQGNPIVGDFLPILWAHGGDIFDADWNVLVDSAEAKTALSLYIELLNNGKNFEKNDIVSSVANGTAAMSLGWPSWYIVKGASTAGYARIPGKAAPDSAEYPSGVIGNWLMGIPANTQNKDLAIKLLTYLTSAATQKAAADVGAVPTRTSVFTDAELAQKYPFYQTLLTATEQSRERPRTPKWGDIENVFGIELSNAITGIKTIDQALADAKIAIENAIK
ncbi:MAG: extracellular solute-binding protein [Christensenellales bacterium]